MSPIVSHERVEEMLEPFGGVAKTLERLREYDLNWEYFEAHRDALTREYPDQWIAVRRQRVVAHGDSAEEVMRVVRDVDGEQSSTVLRYLSTDERVWLL